MVNLFSPNSLKKWPDHTAMFLLWLLLVAVFLFSLFNLFFYFFVPVDGATIWARQGPVTVGDTLLSTTPLQAGDVVLGVEGRSLDETLSLRWRTLPFILDRIGDPTSTIEVTVQRANQSQTLTVPLVTRPGDPIRRLFFTRIIVGYAFLLVGGIILTMRGQGLVERIAALILILLALVEQNEILLLLGTELGWSMLWLFIPLRLLTRWFAYSYTLVFALHFPQPKTWLKRMPYLPLLIHLVNPLVTGGIMLSTAGNLYERHAAAFNSSKNVYIVLLLLACVAFIHSYFTAQDVTTKNQLRWIAWGVVMAVVPNILLFDLPIVLFGHALIPIQLTGLLLLFIPVVIAVAILRYRLWEIELVIKASILYGTLTVILGGIYWLFAFLFIALLGQARGGSNNTIAFFFSALLVAALFSRVRDYLQRVLDRVFFRRLNYPLILATISRALATSLLLDDLLKLLTQTIPAQLNLQKGQVLLDVTPPAHTEEYETLKKGSIVWLHKKADGTFKTHPSPLAEWQAAGVWACLPLLSGDKILGLYGVGPKKSGEYYNREEITLLETLARQAGVALQNAQLHQELSTQVRIRRDLEIAHQIQLSLLPLQAPAIPGLDIAGFSHPADEVGGDFYHYFDFADGRAGIAVGDVSGKGVSAALYMAVSLSTLRAQATHYLHTADLLTEMNNVLHTQMELNAMNVAMLYALFEKNGSPHKWTFRVSNAGLIAPLLYRRGQPGVYVDSGGLPIGAIAAVNYQEHCLELASGDLIIVCSDGVVEAQNRQGEMFGFERLEQTLSRPNGISAGEAVNTLQQAVTHFVGSAPQHDDITVVAVRVK